MYNVVFETDSPNVREGSIFGHIHGAITVQVIADSPAEATANALVLLKGHRLSIGGVAKQVDMVEWRGIMSMRDCEVAVS